MAGHVAERAGAEVEPAAPVERLIIRVVGPIVGRRRGIRTSGRGWGCRACPWAGRMPCGQIGRLVQTRISLIGPRMPERISSTPARKPFSAVPWLPIWVQSFFSAASVRISRASSIDQVSGFWQKQCLPIRMAITLAGAWRVVGRADGDGVDLVAHLLEHLAVVEVLLRLGVLLRPSCRGRSLSMSQRATISPCLPASLVSLSPLPPTPMQAKRTFSFGDGRSERA